MPWLLASPGHQHSWYWPCRIGRFLSYWRKDFNYLCHVSVEEWHDVNTVYVFVPSEKFDTSSVKLTVYFVTWKMMVSPVLTDYRYLIHTLTLPVSLQVPPNFHAAPSSNSTATWAPSGDLGTTHHHGDGEQRSGVTDGTSLHSGVADDLSTWLAWRYGLWPWPGLLMARHLTQGLLMAHQLVWRLLMVCHLVQRLLMAFYFLRVLLVARHLVRGLLMTRHLVQGCWWPITLSRGCWWPVTLSGGCWWPVILSKVADGRCPGRITIRQQSDRQSDRHHSTHVLTQQLYSRHGAGFIKGFSSPNPKSI